jgi:hypothetical protein
VDELKDEIKEMQQLDNFAAQLTLYIDVSTSPCKKAISILVQLPRGESIDPRDVFVLALSHSDAPIVNYCAAPLCNLQPIALKGSSSKRSILAEQQVYLPFIMSAPFFSQSSCRLISNTSPKAISAATSKSLIPTCIALTMNLYAMPPSVSIGQQPQH